MKKRDLVVSIILSIVTCGIYAFFWIAQMTNDANKLSGRENEASGGLVVLLGIITCGIYFWYWNYQMGKKVYEIQLKNNMPATDNSLLFLLLAVFGFSIVNWALIQNELNKFAVEGV